ncbi:MAG: cytochrome c [Pseudomonadota bacterium]
MRGLAILAALALTACGTVPEPVVSNTSVVSVSLPGEPAARWTGPGGALIERNCAACHSPEMIANQPPLTSEKWQATIDKMRTVYGAQIAEGDDAALVAALQATQR